MAWRICSDSDMPVRAFIDRRRASKSGSIVKVQRFFLITWAPTSQLYGDGRVVARLQPVEQDRRHALRRACARQHEEQLVDPTWVQLEAAGEQEEGERGNIIVVRKAVRAHSRRQRRAPGQPGRKNPVGRRCKSLHVCGSDADLHTFWGVYRICPSGPQTPFLRAFNGTHRYFVRPCGSDQLALSLHHACAFPLGQCCSWREASCRSSESA